MQIADALRLAIRHFNAGQASDGIAICTAILDAQPGNPVANALMGRDRLAQGDAAAARAHVDRALASAPDYPAALELDARLKDEREDAPLETTRRAYRRALAANPASSTAWFHHGNLSQARDDDPDAALTDYRRARAVAPGDPAIAMNQATAALKLGDPGAALALCEHTLDAHPAHIRALALKTTALFDLGETAAADRLTGYGSLTRVMTLAVPEGYPDLDAFNRDFTEAIRTHPNRRDEFDPNKRAIRGGAIVTDLIKHDHPAVRAFHAALDATIAAYALDLPADASHPHIAARPASYALDVWGNILVEDGHQTGHIHNLGWLSGVYYAAMPDAVSEADPDHQGWIEFNRPGYGIPDQGSATLHLACPQPGMIALFPSYVWHRTVPFTGAGERISVAFDLHPR